VADDARYLQKAREEEAEHLETVRNTPPATAGSSKSPKLVEVSPEKKNVSKNVNLLIDLDFGAEVSAPQSYANAASSGKGKGKAKPSQNFLN
jgi:ribosomal protein L3